MSRPYVGCLCEEDYPDIKTGVELAWNVVGYFKNNKCRIDVPTERRFWEWGSAVQLMLTSFDGHNREFVKVLNVGAGWDGLGVTLAEQNFDVTECEPEDSYRQGREWVNAVLIRDGRNPITLLPNGLDNLPKEQYDAVFCMSVLEHVHDEEQCWVRLGNRVKPGGLLFLTVDCVEDAKKNYVADNVRVTKYTPELLKQRVDMMVKSGFNTLGTPDYEWKGAMVEDYTFFRAGFQKHGEGVKNENLFSNDLAGQVRSSGVRSEPTPVYGEGVRVPDLQPTHRWWNRGK